MRHYPEADDTYDQEELARLNAQDWQVEQLKLNPDYVSWGPHEDYMWVKNRDEGGKGGWNARILLKNWNAFIRGEDGEGGLGLDDLNECVNFYFSLERSAEDCPSCTGNGYHPDAQWVSESWYKTSSPFAAPDAYSERIKQGMNEMFGSNFRPGLYGHQAFPDEATLAKYGPEFRAFCEEMRDGDGEWCHDITQDEVDALLESRRLHDLARNWVVGDDGQGRWVRNDKKITAEAVNEWSRGRGMGHDGINRGICIKARLERFGIPKTCPACEGHGSRYTEPAARLALVLWWLHPRKGCSRGIEVGRIEREQLPEVYAYLKAAADRNAARFAKVVALAPEPVAEAAE
jgi:hypothetical protein